MCRFCIVLTILLTSLLVSSSALTLQQHVVPTRPAEQPKESLFSFTHEVLRAWKPGRSASLPRLKLAAPASGERQQSRQLRRKTPHASNATLPISKPGNASSSRYGTTLAAAAGVRQQSKQQPSKKKNHTDMDKGKQAISQAEDTKEKVFSFTREVLHAWTPGQTAPLPRLKLAASARPNAKKSSAAAQQQQRKFRSVRGDLHDAKSDKFPSKVNSSNHPFSQKNLSQSAQPHQFKALQGMLEKPLSTTNDTANVLDLSAPPLRFHAAGISEKAADMVAMLFVVAVLILISCCAAVFLDFDSHDYGMGLEDTSPRLWPSNSQSSMKSLTDLLAAVEDADGTWAQNYKEAEGKRKMALELVFRCSIIPAQEFAHSRVSQEHIDECVWIATHMLRKKSLEEWVAQWVEARLTFEESVTACFQARTAVLDTNTTSPIPQRQFATPPRRMRSPGAQRQTSTDEAVLSRDSAGENLLVIRCREIMASSQMQTLDTPKQFRSPSPKSPLVPARRTPPSATAVTRSSSGSQPPGVEGADWQFIGKADASQTM